MYNVASQIDDWETRAWCPFCSYVLSEACRNRKSLIHYTVCTADRDVHEIAWAPEISIWEKISYQWHCLICRSARVPSELLGVESFGWSLIYRKLKSLIITYSNSNRSTCDYWEQRNSGDRGTVRTEEQRAQRNVRHRGTQRNVRHRGTQRNSGHKGTVGDRGTVGTEER